MSDGGGAQESDAVGLLRALIREACVNDGRPDSGQEIRSVRVLQRFLAPAVAAGRIETQVLESAPGRASLIARVRGTDPSAPSLGLLGHLDVVPVDPEGWTRNPFGGDLIDGEIWGRGAVDMLYLTAAFAAVLRETALAPERPRGDLVLLAVADEEAGGEYGIHWLVREHPDAMRVSEALSESGGMRMGAHVAIEVAEKGSAGRRLVIRGKPGHASIPYGAASAAYRVGEVLQRLGEVAPAAQPSELWDAFVAARIGDPALAERLRDPVSIDAALPHLGGIAGYAHAVSRITLSPTVLRAGMTHNVIPAVGTIDLDIRTLPGTSDADVDQLLAAVLGPLIDEVEIQHLRGWAATASSAREPLFAAIERAVGAVAGAPVVPIMAAGGSDARVLRELGIPAYGFGLLGPDWTYERYREGVHGNDERIDVESVELSLAALRLIVAERVGGLVVE
ncbi:M20/M25/M40 family metallo-hydrolase [Leucobacter triazinivorans]|uniref:M20/M25/M40 family metallo-hydrolase n=1 Tax=Leucobacter triazinivorans TaxID=1784719 RepID=A0A4P6KFF3_9MICO|nr:M20/M25/M40 family metallo-hydrolase [Leucobacter triazinivorans]QBE49146.1 M20/M25/M40 family metallo-hydrolase [Leucobacter triazinivorans]